MAYFFRDNDSLQMNFHRWLYFTYQVTHKNSKNWSPTILIQSEITSILLQSIFCGKTQRRDGFEVIWGKSAVQISSHLQKHGLEKDGKVRETNESICF